MPENVPAQPHSSPVSPARRHWALAMALYLLGIFMGAIDTGIVTPGRTVIQRDLQVDDQTGIWMITVYTLAYAASIPIMGKLADRFGRKPIYLVSIVLFGLGSLACGLSQDLGSFQMLIAARAIQAIGGGGILPIATAEIGTEVPAEKRGMALGLVGAVYGIANIFGASAGSLILDIVGVHNWQWIFYVNVPIALAIVGLGIAFLPDHKESSVKPIDVLGSLILVGMILSLLYGIRNLDFFDFVNSIRTPEVWPFLLGFVVLTPIFVLVERRASDPVLNLRYFTDFSHGGVLLLSLLSGVALMAVVFVPQFAENGLRIHAGAGGYTVIALGLASGVGAPMSGTLTDRFGARPVLALGAALSLAASLCALLWTIPQPSAWSIFTALILFGLGLGFVIGSPLNYLMLSRTPKAESNSALGTLSLMRSIGTTLAPAIMVGFIAQAGTLLQDRLIDQLPSSIAAPVLPYQDELQQKFAAMKADDKLAEQLKDVELPDLGGKKTIEIDMNGGGTLPDDLIELLKTADVTNIVDRTKTVASRMFATQTPTRVADIQSGVAKGIAGLDTAKTKLDATASDMTDGLKKMDANLADMRSTVTTMTSKLSELDASLKKMASGISGMDSGLAGMDKAIAGLKSAVAGMDAGLAQQKVALAALKQQLAAAAGTPAEAALAGQVAGLQAGVNQLQAQRDAAASQLSTLTAKRATLAGQRQQLVTARAGASTGRTQLAAARTKLSTGIDELTKARADLASGRQKVSDAQADLADTRTKMLALSAAVPGAFDQALADYLAEIDKRSARIESTFQSTLGEGFWGVFAVHAAACVLMLLLLPLIGGRKLDEASNEADAEGVQAPAMGH